MKMESLHLPVDLLWEGKQELPSPPRELFNSEEELDFNFANDIFLDDDTLNDYRELAAEQLILQDFKFEDKLLEDSWLDRKIDIPPLEEYQPALIEPIRSVSVKPENTNQLIMEFESVYDAVELTHLTPPQTPPQEQNQHLRLETIDYTAFVFEDQHHHNYQHHGVAIANAAAMAVQQPSSIIINTTAPTTAAHEDESQSHSQYAFPQYYDQTPVDSPMCDDDEGGLRVVDELLRKSAQELPDCIELVYQQQQQTPQSDSHFDDDSTNINHSEEDEDDEDEEIDDDSSMSNGSSSLSGSPSPRSEYSSSSSFHSNDDDWSPKSKSLSGVTKRRSTRPYGRSGEEKKSRKKEQNKNAATRYRRKKKQEIEVILEEENELKAVHDELQTKHDDLKREVKYLKGLMRELFRAKGMEY